MSEPWPANNSRWIMWKNRVYRTAVSNAHPSRLHLVIILKSLSNSLSTGTNLRFKGRLSGNINGIKFHALLLDVIAITKDGRVYAVIRNPPVGLAHSLKILTPFADVVGWMLGVQNVKGVPSGFTVIGNRFTRSAVILFDSGKFFSQCGISNRLVWAIRVISTSLSCKLNEVAKRIGHCFHTWGKQKSWRNILIKFNDVEQSAERCWMEMLSPFVRASVHQFFWLLSETFASFC